MASSFPKSLDALVGSVEQRAARVAELTDGWFEIRVFAAGEIGPPLQMLDAVQNGTVECGQTAGCCYVGKRPAFAFDTALPFGLNARRQNAWMYHGGGCDFMRELYRELEVSGHCFRLRDRLFGGFPVNLLFAKTTGSKESRMDVHQKARLALRRQRLTPASIGAQLGLSRATVARICARAGLNRLARLEWSLPVRRYERAEAGGLRHLDIETRANHVHRASHHRRSARSRPSSAAHGRRCASGCAGAR